MPHSPALITSITDEIKRTYPANSFRFEFEKPLRLKDRTLASAAEDYYTKARDPCKLFAAIREKLIQQANYVVWRATIVKWGGKQDNRSVILPDADPGHMAAHRWRKRFCAKTEKVRDV